MAKSVLTTYILWLIGGWFGLHHLYLGRDRHAFVWWCTMGGVFGMGWLRDLSRIPEYVDDANERPEYVTYLVSKFRSYEKPPFNVTRFAGQLILGSLFGYLTLLALPENLLKHSFYRALIVFVPYGVALGVHCVGNIGRESGNVWFSLIGAYITFPLYRDINKNHNVISLSAVVSTVLFNWLGKEWRRKPRRKSSLCKRFCVLSFCGLLYLSMWGSFLFWNTSITYHDGETVKVHEALKHFFNSPLWNNMKHSVKDMLSDGWKHGWWAAGDRFTDMLDPLGEIHAYEVLGLERGASEMDVTSSYRKLAKQWHPDRHKEPEAKQAATQKFMEIQEAYETLSKIKIRRAKRNKVKDDTYDVHNMHRYA
ncbi:PREDICTED: dnaJ homolog subfamily C member 22-like [Priapulus caudatus]|uniref:DnaJ homolog subfamily C member 22 n=1 Tax=Priapulus caudatus TaxID=37621 RepID=A0ABM1DW94_PRICU|nr:PREDICTED: dnaJ homolog subfamily C member 22-like [Priapulus caudatus]XP_014664215.1 PREDICTED: dnaJ homolog subfamily C member 22-like [Priapulus caudatus]